MKRIALTDTEVQGYIAGQFPISCWTLTHGALSNLLGSVNLVGQNVTQAVEQVVATAWDLALPIQDWNEMPEQIQHEMLMTALDIVDLAVEQMELLREMYAEMLDLTL